MKIVTVRKEHFCDNPSCNRLIKKGEKAKTIIEKVTRVSGVGFYYNTQYYHLECRIP